MKHTKELDFGSAHCIVEQDDDGQAAVSVRRAYAACVAPSTADQVWRISADFGGVKVLFPSLVRLYLTYPDAASTQIGLVRDMTFASPPGGGDLAFGIERLVAIDEARRSLSYTSVLGMPVEDYRSDMSVVGDNACDLHWRSTCRVAPANVGFLDTLASILAAGANQIAAHLGLA